MDLPHEPSKGVSRSDDLSGTVLTLSRQRGGDMIAGLMAGALVLGMAAFTDGDAHLFAWPLLLGAGLLLNQMKTRVSLGARAVTVESQSFGRVGRRDSVPYEALSSIEVVPGWMGGSSLLLHRVGGESIMIPHGTPSDHEALRLAIDARRPIQRLPTEAELREPAELRALRSKQGSTS